MTATAQLDIAPVDLPQVDAARSPFERTTLPDFAKWFVERVVQYRPDYIVPVETKGARLLEAVEMYAARGLGSPLRVPVLYSPALSYFTDSELRDSRLLLLDDAISSGNNFERHRQRVLDHGGAEFRMLACIGLVDSGQDTATKTDVECFETLDWKPYRRKLWQLSELVVSRGLPPEVDHHVFNMAFRGRVTDLWPRLIELLGRFGRLSIDGTLTANADVVSMTLHFPELPDAPRYPFAGVARDEGVKKIRVFVDLANDRVHVVPMAFPALRLRPGAQDDLSESESRAVVRGWTGERATVADLLLDRACRHDPEQLFRVISTVTEFDLIRDFARTVAAELGDTIEALDADRELLHRLFGRSVGDEVGDFVDGDIADALAASVGVPRSDAEPPVKQADAEVRWATTQIARHLRWLHTARATAGNDPSERAGLSLTEIARDVLPGRLDELLISRSIDFGLAMTTLVPYTDRKIHEDGTVEVRRKYRVPERDRGRIRGRKSSEDMDEYWQELGEEVVALAARDLTRTVDQWREDGVPHQALANVVAILRRVVLDEASLRLDVDPTEDGMQVRLGPRTEPQTMLTVDSEHFKMNGEYVQPTVEFENQYAANELRLEEYRIDALESALRVIGEQLNDHDESEDLLRSWAASSESRRGLGVIETLLRRAITGFERPIKLLLTGRMPEPKVIVDAAERGRTLAFAARNTLDVLADGPAADLHAQWTPDRKKEQRLRDALATPTDPPMLFDLARQTIDAVVELSQLLERVALWSRDEPSPDAARELLVGCAAVQTRLTTIDGTPPVGPVDDDADVRRRGVAAALERTCGLVKARAAATAWRYRGIKQRRARHEGEERFRATAMVADLAGSTPRSVREPHPASSRWNQDALDLVAQWAWTFGGFQINESNGDDIKIEFPDEDSAVLCAAVVQAHTKALRGLDESPLDWQLRITIDSGELTASDRNLLGRCLNLATKLKDFRKDDPDAFERVLITDNALRHCSAAIRERLATRFDEQFPLDPGDGDSDALSVAVWAVDGPRASAALLAGAAPGADRQPSAA